MRVFNYHPETGEYLNESQADESPLEKGVFLIPAHATEVPPPAAETGKRRVFEAGDWTLRDIALPPEPAPAEIKAARRREADLQREARLAEGVLWSGRRWQIDDVMRSALQWRITRWQLGRLAVDATLPVRAMDNTIQMLGRDDHLALAEAIEAYGAQIYAESWAAKDAL